MEYDRQSFELFLDAFCADHPGVITEDGPLPLRLLTYYLTEAELEGECLSWALQYLAANQCPPILASHIARTVADRVLQMNVEPYRETLKPDSGTKHSEANLEPRLEVCKLSPLVYTLVNETCARWRTRLPPLTMPQRHLVVSSHAIKNTRRKMEDKHVILPHLNQLLGIEGSPENAYFAVFDGHGGLDAATYASAQLHCNIARHLAFYSDIPTALREAYIKTDHDFVKKAKREALRSGSTGVCAVLRERMLHIAWLGDSQVAMVRDGESVELMVPHKPDRPDEKQRIEAMGGCVVWFGAWRVNGNLSVSRAIGDADYKPYISGEPDIASFELNGTEDYVVLGCDGLWDTVSSEDLASEVYDHLQENKGDKAGVAQKLVKLARDRGSNDNISVVVVFLRDDIAPPKGKQGSGLKDEGGEEDNKDEKKKKEKSNEGADKDNNNERRDLTSSSIENAIRDAGSGSGNGKANGKQARRTASYACVGILNEAVGSRANLLAENGRLKDPVTDSPIPRSFGVSQGLSELSNAVSSVTSSASVTSQSSLQSDASHSDLMLMSQTATKAVNRRGKRGRNGRGRRNTKENRRPSKETNGSGVAHRTNGATPTSRPRSSSDTKLRWKSVQQSQESISRRGDHLFRMLTGGYSVHTMPRTKSRGHWTVAVEIESGSAMFEDRCATSEDAGKSPSKPL